MMATGAPKPRPQDFIRRLYGRGSAPGSFVFRQPPIVVDDAHLTRLAARPYPKDDIDVTFRRAKRITRHDHAGAAGRHKALGKAPTRRRFAARRDGFPRTSKLAAVGPCRVARSQVREVENIRAADLVGAESQRLRLEGKALLRLQPRRFRPARRIERRDSFWIEPSAVTCGPFAGFGRERPARIVTAINGRLQTNEAEPQA